MTRFLVVAVTVFGLGATAWAEPIKPVVEVRVKAIGELAPILEYGGDLFGQADAGKQFAGILKQFTGDEKGYEGIDLNRPIGVYVGFAEQVEDSPIVLMVPVADADAVVGALAGKLGLDPKKGEGGLYSVDVPNVPGTVYFRFADKYAYVTFRSEKGIEPAKLITPKAFFAEKASELLTVAVHIDRVPADVRKLMYGQLEMQIKEKNSQLTQTPAEKLMNEFLMDVSVDAAKTVLLDGDRLTVSFDIDPKADEVKLNVGLSAKSGTTLEKTLAGFGDRESVAAGVGMSAGAASKQVLNFQLPPETTKKFATLVDAMAKQAIDDAKENDKVGVKLFADALVPTLKAGDFQLGFQFTKPTAGNKLGGVVAMKTVSGGEISKLTTVMAVGIPKEAGSLMSNVDAIGERKLHKLTLNKQDDNPLDMSTSWMMTSDDLIAATTGAKTDPLKAVASAKPVKTPMLYAETSFAGLAPLMAKDTGAEKVQKAITEVFGEKPDGRDTLKITGRGGKRFDLTVSMKGKAIALLVALDKAKKGE